MPACQVDVNELQPCAVVLLQYITSEMLAVSHILRSWSLELETDFCITWNWKSFESFGFYCPSSACAFGFLFLRITRKKNVKHM